MSTEVHVHVADIFPLLRGKNRLHLLLLGGVIRGVLALLGGVL
eukprot:CAMPEP_0173385262 /NCGR_PEP_ID=MMETSP1356-20130122/7871_1 /TAXON_ID=77927 ORGANISM="Hemiselmis virescens, Strain PCC157" /NCGR_SAMPLE_ID=MMETSP1356 /ASSEMBLY_ACC=CAM_ASM_000847 /LENGTH=42 /DNA_ID= /DNA_START= /DNA_END= /DNA_ORIENTATION=